MVSFTHFLVPTDFGEAAGCAIDVALTMARAFDAKITLLHVGWVPSTQDEAYRWPAADIALAAKKELDSTLASARVRASYSNIEGLLVSGVPWEQILLVARDRAADLIIMGTNGHRGVSHFLLGSVAEKIVRLSVVPVLTVRPPAADNEQRRQAAVGV